MLAVNAGSGAGLEASVLGQRLVPRRLSHRGLRNGATSPAEQGAEARVQKWRPKRASKLHVNEVTTVEPSLWDEGVSPQLDPEMLNGFHGSLF